MHIVAKDGIRHCITFVKSMEAWLLLTEQDKQKAQQVIRY